MPFANPRGSGVLLRRSAGSRLSRKTLISLTRAVVETLEARTLLSYTVNSLADDSSTGTLRWAIQQADAAGGNQTITLAPALASGGPATISLSGSANRSLPLVLNDTTVILAIVGSGSNLLTINAEGDG